MMKHGFERKAGIRFALSRSMKSLIKGAREYPRQVEEYLDGHSPKRINYIGDSSILSAEPSAVFCSVKCPGDLILKAYDFAHDAREKGLAIISGFQSPVEKDMLRILLRGKCHMIIYSARGIARIRLDSDMRKAIEDGRLLVLSSAAKNVVRSTKHLAHKRNLAVAAIAKSIVIVYAAPDGNIAQLARTAISWNKTVYALPSSYNQALLDVGAKDFRFWNLKSPT